MALYWIYVLAVIGVIVSGDDTCPSPAELSPCTCDGEGVNCMRAKNLQEIKKAFQAKFPYGGIRAVWIQGTPITDLPGDIFGNVKSQQFFIEVNNITTVNMRAFNASKGTLQALSFFGNKITQFPYSELSQYQRLGTLNLAKNQISSVPDNAFNHPNLATIFLAQNQITQIGKNAFNNLPKLARLELSMNSIVTLGPMSFAMKSANQQLQINLSGNKISGVSPSAFNGEYPLALLLSYNELTSLKSAEFSTLVTRIAHKGGFIEVSGNPFSCRGCDYSWIVLNKQSLVQKLIGFTCVDGRAILQLTRANIGC